jgi:hypothetical protein
MSPRCSRKDLLLRTSYPSVVAVAAKAEAIVLVKVATKVQEFALQLPLVCPSPLLSALSSKFTKLATVALAKRSIEVATTASTELTVAL